MSSKNHIDMALFGRKNGGFSVFLSVSEVFLSIMPQWHRDMRQAIKLKDSIWLADNLHNMKGCCGLMGALKLSEMCSSLENLLNSGDFDSTVPQLQFLMEQLNGMEEEVRRLIDERGSV